MRMSILLCLAASAAASAAAGTSIELRAFVAPAKERVTLGDVAYITSESLDDMQRLLATPLGAAPRAGNPRTLERDAIERSVRARLPGLEQPLAWSGAPQVTLERASRTLEGGRILDAARTAPGCAGLPALRETQMPRDLELPRGEITLSARPLAPSPSARHRLVWVDVRVDERLVRSVPVSFVAADARNAPACAPALEGAAIAAAAPRITPSAPAAASPGAGVMRGEWARLRAGFGAVSLESRVQVLQDGRPGETVRVKAAGTAGAILAQVVGPHELEVMQ